MIADQYPRRGACVYCRQKKIRCNGEEKCRNCVRNGQTCFYPRSRRGRRQITSDPPRMKPSSTVYETLAPKSAGHHERTDTCSEPLLPQYRGSVLSTVLGTAHGANDATNSSPLASGLLVMNQHQQTVTYAQSTSPTLFQQQLSMPMPASARSTVERTYMHGAAIDGVEEPFDGEESVISLDSTSWEYHGPSTWLSICSVPGSRWVCEQVGNVDFQNISQSLLSTWTKRIKLRQTVSRSSSEDPDPETSRIYIDAFFDHSVPALHGIIHRPIYESQLRQGMLSTSQESSNASWYALKNIIWAFGCRWLLSRDKSVPFWMAHKQAWRYFENAMSVHSDLMFTPTTLVAVQALALMTFFVDGLGGPVLEFMLSSSTMRLAQSKGLHRKPSKLWKLPEIEVQRRSYLFWAIYCLEKIIIGRSGRSSAMDDTEINCEIPSLPLPGCTTSLEFCRHAIRHAKIASRISKKIGSATVMGSSTPDLFNAVQDLDRELRDWHGQLPDVVKVIDVHSTRTAKAMDNSFIVNYLDSCYLGSILQLHSCFYYPWTRKLFPHRSQVTISASRVPEAAHQCILAIESTRLSADSLSSQSLYLPLLSAIVVFVAVLQDPTTSTASNHIAVLDVAAGHFARMELLTESELSFSIVRELAEIARDLCKRSSRTQPAPRPVLESVGIADTCRQGIHDFHPEAENEFDNFDFDLDCWNVFTTDFVQNMFD